MGLPLRERVKHFFSALVNYAKYVTQQPRTAMTCRPFSSDYEYRYGEVAPAEHSVFVWRMRKQSGVNLGNRMGRLVIT